MPARALPPPGDATDDADAPDVVRIGLLLPLTGPNVQVGAETRILAEIFENAINYATELALPLHYSVDLPNLGGARVEFVIGDSANPDIVMSEAERLITQHGVVAVTGQFTSASTLTGMVPAERHGGNPSGRRLQILAANIPRGLDFYQRYL